MALGSTQLLTEMITRNISWGKGDRCVRLTTYHNPVPLSRNLGTLTSWNLVGLSRSVMGLLYLTLFVTFIHRNINIRLLDRPTNLILTLRTCMKVHTNLPYLFYRQVCRLTPAATQHMNHRKGRTRN